MLHHVGECYITVDVFSSTSVNHVMVPPELTLPVKKSRVICYFDPFLTIVKKGRMPSRDESPSMSSSTPSTPHLFMRPIAGPVLTKMLKIFKLLNRNECFDDSKANKVCWMVFHK